jgi:hypothetical protein
MLLMGINLIAANVRIHLMRIPKLPSRSYTF